MFYRYLFYDMSIKNVLYCPERNAIALQRISTSIYNVCLILSNTREKFFHVVNIGGDFE